MDIFLDPDHPFSISLVRKGQRFEVVEGAEIQLRTATGRELATISRMIRDDKTEDAYDILPKFVVSGIDRADISRLHPNAVAVMILEIYSRSKLSEEQAGN